MENSLQVIEQKEVIFYEDTILAVQVKGGSVYVPIRPICDLLGVDSASQRRRIQRDAVLSEESKLCDVVTTSQDQQPQVRSMLCLPLDFISGFLFGINAQRVKPELKDRLIRYQKECYKVLNEAFQEGRLTAEPSFETILSRLDSDNDAVMAYQMAQAVMKLAQNQVLMEAKITVRLDTHEQRLESLESQLQAPAHAVSQDEAMQISQAVKTVAIAQGKVSGQNEFGGVYGELYRKFGITSYKLLPAAKYQEAMDWLAEWHQSIVGDSPF